ncbi:MAG: hypothetical protein ABSB40_10100 [Nitrososphaeria archaeon]|jgi:PAS domain-containing protein
MREAYAKAAEKYLVTTNKGALSQDEVIATFNRQFLKIAGYTEEEIKELGDLSKFSPKQL